MAGDHPAIGDEETVEEVLIDLKEKVESKAEKLRALGMVERDGKMHRTKEIFKFDF